MRGKHDFNVYLEIRDELRDALKSIRDQTATIALQLGAWLVLGNAAGVYFLANAAVNRHVELNAQFSHVYILFLIGAALAFLAMCWTYFVSMPFILAITNAAQDNLQLAHREQLTAELEEDKVAPPEDFERQDRAAMVRLEATVRQLRRAWAAFAVSVSIYVISAICFLVGLATPLLGGLTLTSPS
ncbi:hypothetical protein [Terricaulis sp.]|uniref:hypothetical protein n=1 Tax=Terricaulis sp. TaxID=2768686 RepID=UPI0037847BF6